MALERATRKETIEHYDDKTNDVIALTVVYAVWDTRINPLADGDGNDNARIFEVFIDPDTYRDCMAGATAAARRTAIRGAARDRLRAVYRSWADNHRRRPGRLAAAAASALLGAETVDNLD